MHILQSVWIYHHKRMPQPMLYCITACGGILNGSFEPGTVWTYQLTPGQNLFWKKEEEKKNIGS